MMIEARLEGNTQKKNWGIGHIKPGVKFGYGDPGTSNFSTYEILHVEHIRMNKERGLVAFTEYKDYDDGEVTTAIETVDDVLKTLTRSHTEDDGTERGWFIYDKDSTNKPSPEPITLDDLWKK